MIIREGKFFSVIFIVSIGIFLGLGDVKSETDFKIPFEKGETWRISTGYEGYKTHAGKDKYALDFSWPGEEDYGEEVLAVASGEIKLKESQIFDEDINEYIYIGYGRYIDIDHGDGFVSRYAHLKEFSVKDGEKVKQGQKIGEVNSTGNSDFSHLHFVVYKKGKDGKLEAYKPEPMSGFTNITEDKYYTSDNELYDPNKPKEVEQGDTLETNKKEGFFSKVKTKVKNGFVKVGRGVKNFFRDIFSKEKDVESQESEKFGIIDDSDPQTASEKAIYSLEILNSPSTVQNEIGTEERRVIVKVKNTGNVIWEGTRFSINVVDGAIVNQKYRHSGWLTDLRSSQLDQSEVAPGETGFFSFFINIPQEVGQHIFRAQVVRQEGMRFSRIGNLFFILNINVVEKLEPEKQVETEPTPEPEKKVLGEKIKETAEKVVDDVIDKTKEVVEDVVGVIKEIPKRVFSGGRSSGGGGSAGTTDTTTDTTSDASIADTTDETGVESPEISIIKPTASSTITNFASSTIAGTKNEATESVYINESTEEVVFVSSTVWQASVELSEGHNSFEIYGENSLGEKTATSTVEIILDSTPPTVPVVTTELDTFSTPTIRVAWSASDEGVGLSNYDVEYKIDEGGWQSLLTSTTSTEYLMEVELLSTYNFRARASDELGNVSEWSSEDSGVLADWPKTVVINELAWMGTSWIHNAGSNCTKHEWVELYNPGSSEIDLTGWTLETDNQTFSLSGSVVSEGYYLLAREHGRRVALLNLDIDLISQSFEVPNSGARLLLKNSDGNIMDELNFEEGWPAGVTDAGPVNNIYQPMGRVAADAPGSFDSNWQTMDFITPFGRNNCGKLYGTPGRANQGMWLIRAPTYYYSDHFVDNILTLKKENNPYIIGYNFAIPAGSTLKIEPGVILIGENNSASLDIEGSLIINGTVEDPVVFTSARDTTYGEWNLPYFDSDPAEAGDWSRVTISEGASATINNTKFLYGGNSFRQSDGFYFLRYFSHVLYVTGGTASVNNSEFANTFTHASYPKYNAVIWADNSDAVTTTLNITDSLFDTGYTAIKADKINNGAKISVTQSDNIFQNFSSPSGPVDLSEVEVATSTP